MTTLSQDVAKKTNWSIFLGFLTAAIGIVMIVYPLATATFSTLALGWALIFAGAAQAFFAFSSDSAGNFFLNLLLGILYGIAGIALVAFPPAGVVTLTWVIGVMLIADAVVEMVLAFSLPAGEGRGWFIASSVASGLLGIMVIAEWPASSGWTIGTLVGVAVLFNGISRIVISATIRHGVKAADQLLHA